YYNLSTTVYQSVDGGYTWRPNSSTSSVPQGVVSVEDVVGDGCGLFVPTNDLGIYYTTDDGNNWQPMNGAPNQPLQPSRAYVTSTKIWSFQSSGGAQAKDLMSTTRPTSNINVHFLGVTPTSSGPPDYTITFPKVFCNTAADTAIGLYGCNCGPT